MTNYWFFCKYGSLTACTFLPSFIKAMGYQAVRCTSSRTAILCHHLTYALLYTLPPHLSQGGKQTGI